MHGRIQSIFTLTLFAVAVAEVALYAHTNQWMAARAAQLTFLSIGLSLIALRWAFGPGGTQTRAHGEVRLLPMTIFGLLAGLPGGGVALMHPLEAVPWAAGAAAFTGAVAVACGLRGLRAWGAGIAIMAICSYFAAVTVNVTYDDGPPTSYTTRVQRIEHGSRGEQYARLSPWGDLRGQKSISLAMGHRFVEDMDVQVTTRPGFLRMEWIEDVR